MKISLKSVGGLNKRYFKKLAQPFCGGGSQRRRSNSDEGGFDHCGANTADKLSPVYIFAGKFWQIIHLLGGCNVVFIVDHCCWSKFGDGAQIERIYGQFYDLPFIGPSILNVMCKARPWHQLHIVHVCVADVLVPVSLGCLDLSGQGDTAAILADKEAWQ